MVESLEELIRLLLFNLNATNNYTDETEILLLNRSSSESSIIIGNSSWNGNSSSSSFTKWEELADYHVDRFHFSLTFKITVYISYNSVIAFALLGNVLVVYVVAFSAQMRTVNNYFIGTLKETNYPYE
jgi:hypothetical protein